MDVRPCFYNLRAGYMRRTLSNAGYQLIPSSLISTQFYNRKKYFFPGLFQTALADLFGRKTFGEGV